MWRRRILVLAVLPLGLGLVVPTASAAAAAAPAPVDQSPLARAKATGQRVELPERTTATGETFVNPDGTMTNEQHAQPVRGRKDGRWVPIDTSLRLTDAGVVPTAGAVQVAFSAGG